MVTPEDREFMWNTYAPEPRMRLNLGIRRRLAPLMNNDQRKILLLYSMLMTLPGTPVLYYGDQIGMGDNINLPDRNGVRTPMQWDSGPNAGFSSAPAYQLYTPVIDDEVYGYRRVNVAAQQANPDSLLNRIRHMIHTRKRLTALAEGELHWAQNAPLSTLVFWRATHEQTLLLLHNLADSTMQAPLAPFAAAAATDVLTGEPVALGETLALPPYAFHWLEIAGNR